MKVVHINTWSIGSGASVAAQRHCEAMQRYGIDAKMLYLEQRKESDTNTVFQGGFVHYVYRIKRLFINFLIDKICCHKTAWSYNIINNDISNISIIKEADVIYLHWVCGQFVSAYTLENLLKTGKKVVWYMHDMFPFTGGCHYTYGCENFQRLCNNCSQIDRFSFLSSFQLRDKIKHLSRYDNLIISAPSHWLLNESKKSSVFKNKKHIVCRNVIDEKLFYPKDKSLIRKKYKLSLEKTYVLLSVYNAESKYKGVKYLIEALEKLDNENIELLIMGTVQNTELLSNIKLRYHLLGFLSDKEKIVEAYNMADMLVIPSIMENYPNVIVEAFACKVPVVAFRIGGIPELVIHKSTGWLAEACDPDGLREGILWINEHKEELCDNCLKHFMQNCSYSSVVKNHEPIWNL